MWTKLNEEQRFYFFSFNSKNVIRKESISLYISWNLEINIFKLVYYKTTIGHSGYILFYKRHLLENCCRGRIIIQSRIYSTDIDDRWIIHIYLYCHEPGAHKKQFYRVLVHIISTKVQI